MELTEQHDRAFTVTSLHHRLTAHLFLSTIFALTMSIAASILTIIVWQRVIWRDLSLTIYLSHLAVISPVLLLAVIACAWVMHPLGVWTLDSCGIDVRTVNGIRVRLLLWADVTEVFITRCFIVVLGRGRSIWIPSSGLTNEDAWMAREYLRSYVPSAAIHGETTALFSCKALFGRTWAIVLIDGTCIAIAVALLLLLAPH